MGNKKKRISSLIFAFFACFLLHCLPLLFIKVPTSGPDEVISLSYAAQLAGYDWSYLSTYFGTRYGFGSSWFLFPLFYIFKNGLTVYYIARIVLAFILSLQTIICYRILKDYFECQNEKEICLISIAVSFLTNATADIFCNEALLTLSTWLYVYILLNLYHKGKSFIYSLFLCLVFLYGLICHERSIIYLPSIIFSLLMITIIKKKNILDFRAVLICIPLVFGVFKLKKYVSIQVYGNAEALKRIKDSSGNEIDGLFHNLILIIKECGLVNTIKGGIRVSLSNTFGLMIYSWLLLSVSAVCALFLVYYLLKGKREAFIVSNAIIMFFCFMGLTLSLVAMGTIHCWHGIILQEGRLYNDGRFFFYLRYYINFFPPLIIPTYYMLKKKNNRMIWIASLAVSFLVYISFQTAFVNVLNCNKLYAFDVGKLFEAASFGVGLDYSLAYKIGVLLFLIPIAFAKKKNVLNIWIIMLMCMTMYQQIYQCIFFRKPISDSIVKYTNEFIKLSNNRDFLDYLEKNQIKLGVLSHKVYRPEYFIQLCYPGIDIRRIEGEEDLDKIVFSNEEIDYNISKEYDCITLDEDEFIYFFDYEDYENIQRIINKGNEK